MRHHRDVLGDKLTTCDLKIYSDPLVNLYHGDSREILRTMPAESVDMVMTSPPYYGLRAYKAESAVWDSVNGCQHEWGNNVICPTKVGRQGVTETVKYEVAVADSKLKPSNFCSLCGAWRGQLGSEPTPDLFIKHLCDIFDEVKRVLKKTGTIYVNLDDSHNSAASNQSKNMGNAEALNEIGCRGKQLDSIPAKSLIGIPARFQLEMIKRGWICRNIIIWHKDSVMPESVKDRFTIDFEYVFMFSKQGKYFFERQFEPYASEPDHRPRNKAQEKYDGTNLFSEGGRDYYSMGQRNKRATWTVNPSGFSGPHYATYPEALCRIPIEASCPEFICTKCGNARTRIYETVGGTIGSGAWVEHGNDAFVGKTRTPTHPTSGPNSDYQTQVIGLTDCGCENPTYEPGVVLDPFSGVATTGVMAKKLGRRYVGIEISEKYHQLAIERITNTTARMV